jgi:hypothetical protein
MTTLRKLIIGSMRLIRVAGADGPPTADDMEISLKSLQGLTDSLGTDLLNIYTTQPKRFLLEAGKESYTLGPAVRNGVPTGADWATERPMRVEKAVVLQQSSISYPVEP